MQILISDTQFPENNASFGVFITHKKRVCDRVAATDRVSDFYEIQNWHYLKEIARV
jgi:hypothetical protein